MLMFVMQHVSITLLNYCKATPNFIVLLNLFASFGMELNLKQIVSPFFFQGSDKKRGLSETKEITVPYDRLNY